MTTSAPAGRSGVLAPVPGLLRREQLFGAFLAAVSGLGVLAAAWADVPLSFTAPFVVLPSAVVLVGMVLYKRRRYGRLHVFSDLVVRGAWWGFIATIVYDVIRPVLRAAFGFTFDPYRAIWIFGELITGLPRTETLSAIAGWSYHFWNGIGFGMTFGLLFPRGGMLPGWIWAMILQGAMMAAYPAFLNARLADPGFLTLGMVGHSLWGLVLGHGMRRSSRIAPAVPKEATRA